MLENKLHDIPYILLLRSDRILKDLLENESLDNNHSLNEAIQDFYSNKFRKESLDQAYHPKCRNTNQLNSGSLDYSFDCLDNLYEEYFKQDGSVIYAKPEKLERYSSIINKVHPFNIVGHHLANKLANGEIDLHTIEELAGNISPLGFSVGDGKRYSDNHVHIIGAKEPINHIWHILTRPQKIKKELVLKNNSCILKNVTFLKLRDILLVIFRLLHKWICYSSIADIKSSLYEINCILNQIEYDKSSELDYFNHLRERVDNLTEPTEFQKLFRLILQKDKEKCIVDSWLIFNIFLHYLHMKSDTPLEIKKMIKVFFHISNLFRSEEVMNQNIGLGYFNRYFNSDFRKIISDDKDWKNYDSITKLANKPYKGIYSTVFTSLFNNGTIKVEAKIGLNDVALSTFEKIHKNFKAVSQETHDFHLSVHLIRGEDNEYNKLYDFFYKKNTIKENIDYSKLIRSLDIAGNENDAPPEDFAPIINYLRYEPKVTKDNLLGYKIVPHKKLQLSVHAGEDFHHIVTGMRRVDETIYYYRMESKDRLGHALAVGLEPKQWLEANGDIIMTKEELLDNFVWLKRKAEEVSSVYPKAQSLIYRYDKYIQTLSFEIYGNDISTTADELYEAWKLRRNDYKLFSDDTADYTTDIYKKSATPDKNNKSISRNAKEIFRALKNSIDTRVRKNGAEIVYVQYEHFFENHSHLKITDEDLELYRIIQDYMLNMIASKNIFIEACPTSNIYISHLSKYEDHPIFRWHPIDNDVIKDSSLRKRIVKVCINTDDPAIMPTNLPTEFEHLRLAGRKLGYDSNSIDTWLEELREFGNEIFDDNHEDIRV